MIELDESMVQKSIIICSLRCIVFGTIHTPVWHAFQLTKTSSPGYGPFTCYDGIPTSDGCTADLSHPGAHTNAKQTMHCQLGSTTGRYGRDLKLNFGRSGISLMSQAGTAELRSKIIAGFPEVQDVIVNAIKCQTSF